MADSFFFYGAYTHTANSVAVKNITKSFMMSPFGKTHILRHSWTIEGKLIIGDGAIEAQLEGLQVAYSVHGRSFGFIGRPALQIDSTATLGGTIVTGPVNHEEMKGSHGVNYLKYTVGLQADFPYVVQGTVLDFNENISFVNHGGGPVYVERLPAVGPPIFQQVTESSWYYATQSGSITTAFSNPQPMAPIWPQFVRTVGPGGLNVVYNSPKMQRGIALSYTTTWRYDYASPFPLEAYPNIQV